MAKAFIVMGYNNTRLADVKKLKSYASGIHSAELVLCKSGLSGFDREAVRHCIECDLEPTAANIDAILGYLSAHSLELLGVLPFSDKGVPIGALLADRMGLRGGDPTRVQGAADKHEYRVSEWECRDLPAFHRVIRAREVRSAEDVWDFWKTVSPSRVFLKPKGEGNSRGCRRIAQADEIDGVFEGLRPYLAGGVLAEECIDGAREYSVDHVAGFSWLTEKSTTTGAYRAEVQQIVPAPLSSEVADRIRQSGFIAAKLCGFNGNAFHNEVFLFPEGHQTAVVEPNLRPAGMRIWDLAALAFDLDPWAAWLNYSRDGKLVPESIRQRAFAGIRMLRARSEGVVTSLPDVSELQQKSLGAVEIVLTKAIGDTVTDRVENNADFIGHVIFASPSYEVTQAGLESCAEKIETAVGVASV
ncbi:hypothetical protein AB0F42_30140 [Streptomyces buecherae]|uniref:ATP-grasp domain-containing protein n=1 Tax=Streptomyces buecherae TaxID=2763006 RepID=UPI0033DC764C